MKRPSGLFAGLALALSFAAPGSRAVEPAPPWTFVVGGDSRNCGDVVMPAVAAGATAAGASFYWHLGDFRWVSDFDQDLLHQPEHRDARPTIAEYQRIAWDDFIQSQLGPFGGMPIFLALGNHELYSPKTRDLCLAQFGDWLNAPEIHAQRLKDDPKDHRLKTYSHWVRHGIDFINLDNASNEQFDADQVKWLEGVLRRDIADPAISTIVAGMHCALPDSIASNHSMSDWPLGEQSERRVYARLLEAEKSGKHVYVLASHSHFYLRGIFNTPYWRAHGGVLPGWIIGTTGAVRYRLPKEASDAEEAKTDVYGYLLATVAADGTIRFDFKELSEADIPDGVVSRYTPAFVHWCFAENRQDN